jgi:hypothetical protein
MYQGQERCLDHDGIHVLTQFSNFWGWAHLSRNNNTKCHQYSSKQVLYLQNLVQSEGKHVKME